MVKNLRSVSDKCVLLMAVFMIVQGAQGQTGVAGKRGVTIADAIAMTQWSDMMYFLGAPAGNRVGLFSPDGTQFVVVVRKGNLKDNSNEYSILLFRTKEAFEAPRPVVVATMASTSNRQAIRDVRWLDDNKTLVFLGENPGEVPEVYSVDLSSNQLKRLTSHPSSVVSFDVTRDGTELIYEAEPPPKKVVDTEEVRKNGLVISNQYASDLLLDDCPICKGRERIDRELYVQKKGETPKRISTPDFLTEFLPLSISPDGRYAFLGVYLGNVPASWSAYKDVGLHPYIVEKRKPGALSNVIEYMLLDPATGQLTPLLDAPVSWRNNGFAWGSGGNSIFVSGSYLSLNITDAVELAARRSSTSVVEVKIPGREISKITDQNLAVRSWNERTEILTLEAEDASKEIEEKAFQRRGSQWEEVPVAVAKKLGGQLRVVLKEDINDPPKIYVADAQGEHETLLYDLNPQFEELSFAKVETIHWKASDGHEARGGLYWPPNYVPGTRYPMVIQTHGYNPNRFWIDGPWDSAFAAQALANTGIIVVQADEALGHDEYTKYWNTPEEAPHEMTMFEGLIDELDRRGLIDRNRVGIIGFSRTVYHVEYTLTHSKYRIAAATVADGFDGSYLGFILYNGVLDESLVNGGLPVGGSLSSWIEHSPGFNTDKVSAPVRIEDYGPGGFLGGWQFYTGLTMLQKPVDFIWLPCGMHLLVKPWERMTSEQGNVDWFRFWLKKEEDPDPGKASQYARWRELRALQPRESQPPSGEKVR